MVVAYSQIIGSSLALYLRNSAAIGSLVNTQAGMVEALFQLQRQFLISRNTIYGTETGTSDPQGNGTGD